MPDAPHPALANLDTLVVVMLENRSFDHLLGYLGLATPAWAAPGYQVDGLTSAMLLDPSPDRGRFFLPDASEYLAGLPPSTAHDPPHERVDIATQIAYDPLSQTYAMDGFVRSFGLQHASLGRPVVQGCYAGDQLPMADFLAQHYAIADRWFAPLPAGTQPNRLMALSGYTLTDINRSLLKRQYLVYDWLKAHGVRYRVYHDGMPFISLMEGLLGPHWFDNDFKSIGDLAEDVRSEAADTFPQVIFVEPLYTNNPFVSYAQAYDDHSPTPARRGQDFLARVYAALTANPTRWRRTAMIATYDEHGGFADHVPPLPVATAAPPGASFLPFISTGARVPAFVISPLVDPGTVLHDAYDHTSILRLIGQRFGNGGGYSDAVDARGDGLYGDLGGIFSAVPRDDIPIVEHPPASMDEAYTAAWNRLSPDEKAAAAAKFPDLFHRDD
jgi:phospholipase C